MKTFLALLIGVALVGGLLALASPQLRVSVFERFPRFTGRETTPGTGHGRSVFAKAAKFEKAQLVGVWSSEDDSELLMIRPDAKVRISLAYNYETKVSEDMMHHATALTVVQAGWTVDSGQFMLVDPRVEKMKLIKLHFAPLTMNTNYDPQAGMKANAGMRDSLPKQLAEEFNADLKKDKFGGLVTTLTDTVLVIESDDGTMRYNKIDPHAAKDPDGKGAPIYRSSSPGAKHEKVR